MDHNKENGLEMGGENSSQSSLHRVSPGYIESWQGTPLSVEGFIRKQTCLRTDMASQPDSKTRTTLTLPYISFLSETIRRILIPLSIRVSFCPFKALKQELVHPKDPVPVYKRKGVIYSIPCVECSRTYIGQTGRSLDRRLQEHCWAPRKEMIQSLLLQSMCLKQATRSTYPRQQ